MTLGSPTLGPIGVVLERPLCMNRRNTHTFLSIQCLIGEAYSHSEQEGYPDNNRALEKARTWESLAKFGNTLVILWLVAHQCIARAHGSALTLGLLYIQATNTHKRPKDGAYGTIHDNKLAFDCSSSHRWSNLTRELLSRAPSQNLTSYVRLRLTTLLYKLNEAVSTQCQFIL